MLASLAAPLVPNEHSEGQRKRVEEICYDGWDLFARVLSDGTIVVRALAVSLFLCATEYRHSNAQ